MHTMRVLISVLISVTIGSAISESADPDEKDYWDQFVNERKTMSLAAARGNPSLVKALNEAALRCLRNIQADLAQYGKTHTVLAGIEAESPEILTPTPSYRVECELSFMKNVTWYRTDAMARKMPNRDGIVLILRVDDPVGFHRPYYGVDRSYNVLVHGMEIIPYFRLLLGDQNKNIEQAICEIIDKQMRAFRKDLKKKQDPKDVPYHDMGELSDPTRRDNDSRVVRE